jgi:hypothetical protein
MMNFLEDRIISRSCSPAKMTTENVKAFISLALELFFKYVLVLFHSSNYYPQENGFAESSNNNIMIIIKKIVGEKKKGWDTNIKYVSWEYNTTTNTSTGKPLLS